MLRSLPQGLSLTLCSRPRWLRVQIPLQPHAGPSACFASVWSRLSCTPGLPPSFCLWVQPPGSPRPLLTAVDEAEPIQGSHPTPPVTFSVQRSAHQGTGPFAPLMYLLPPCPLAPDRDLCFAPTHLCWGCEFLTCCGPTRRLPVPGPGLLPCPALS